MFDDLEGSRRFVIAIAILIVCCTGARIVWLAAMKDLNRPEPICQRVGAGTAWLSKTIKVECK